MVKMMVQWGEDVEKSYDRYPTNLEENSKARLPNARLEGDVGLKFQLKIIEFMDFVNQELKCDKDERAQ